MAEIQYYPSTIQSGVPVLVNGVEVQNGDLALVGQAAGLADDRVLAEFLRLMPTDGTNPVARAILPSGAQPSSIVGAPTHNVTATVSPTASANGSVLINPFRGIVGSRTAVGSGALANWRDIRSTVFVGTATTLAQTYAIASNASGNPRWDLLYAQMTIDAATNAVQRRVKDPNASQPTIQTVYQYLAQGIQIATVQGTPGATPAIPTLPSDSGSTYNIPLALVFVPNGFGPTSTVVPMQIRDVALVASLGAAVGAVSMRPGNQAHDKVNPDGTITAGTYASDSTFGWGTSTPYRSPLFLPPGMQGGETRFFTLDLTNASHQSAASGAVLDDSVDWRNRFFRVQAFLTADTTRLFANDPAAQTSPAASVPHPIIPGVTADGRIAFGMGQSFVADGVAIASKATVFFDAHGSPSGLESVDPLPSGVSYGIACDPTTGALYLYVSGTNAAVRIFFWLEATAQFPNHTTSTP